MFQKNKIYLKGWFAMIILRTTAVDKRSIECPFWEDEYDEINENEREC